MGFMQDMRMAAAGAADAAGNAASATRIRIELSDLNRRKQGLFAQLGEVLYEETRRDSMFRTPYESLYASIESIEKQRMELQQMLDALERPPHVTSQTSTDGRVAKHGRRCHRCGTEVEDDDVFCLECGVRLEEEGKADTESAEFESVEKDEPMGQPKPIEFVEPAAPMEIADKTEPVDEEPTDHFDCAESECDESNQARFCVACGRPLKPEDLFCGWCGTRVL